MRFFKRQLTAKRRDEIHWGRSLAATACMIGAILLASFVLMRSITAMERAQCLDRLHAEAAGIAEYIERGVVNDREQLQVLAAVIAEFSDFASPRLWQLLDSFDSIGLMSRVELLLPDDTVLTAGGKRVDVQGRLSFQTEAAQGVHITDRDVDILDPEAYVLRHYVPVVRSGRTAAMLYGVVVIKDLQVVGGITPYGGKGAMYLIDAHSGDFLIDTWHPGRMGNIWNLGYRETAPGYDAQALMQQMMDGKVNHILFVSRTIGDYMYLHFQPMRINEWRIAISVPQSVVFATSDTIERRLNYFFAFELLCFALFFVWMMRDVRRVTAEKQRRLDTIQHINEIEQLLFNAHEKTENLPAAIEKLGGWLQASGIVFFIIEKRRILRQFRWENGRMAVEMRPRRIEAPAFLLQRFADGLDWYQASVAAQIEAVLPYTEFKAQRSLIVVPVRDLSNGCLYGMLAVTGMPGAAPQQTFIKAVSFSLGRFCRNLKNREDLQEQGDRDTLTGLLNRNRYERDLPEIYAKYRSGLTCVYIDANGLRELNNTLGHELGDRMLRTVAAAISAEFATEYIYRIGGDEFVLFLAGAHPDQAQQSCLQLSKALLAHDYHVSAGIESSTAVTSISALIKHAEQKMYAQKRSFYAVRDRRRSLPQADAGQQDSKVCLP